VTGFYAWQLTFENNPNAMHDLVDRVQQALQVPGLDLVPLSGLHLTRQGLGFTDEVNGRDLIEIIDAARRLCAKLRPLELTLGPVDPDAEGVGLLVQPWAAVEELRSILRTAIGCVWPTVPEASDGFRPHITVAYSGSAAPTQPILKRLVTLRELRPITVNITTASLIALHRDAREYQWDR
jgi:2'-5' RNA ligase